MNEKSLDVLEQYDLNVHKYFRGRGGMVLSTDQGIKLFSECSKPDKYYEREDILTKAVAESGFMDVDTFVKNGDNGIVTEASDGRKYIVKDWFDGRECDVKSITDVCQAVNSMARLHACMNQVATGWQDSQQVSIQEVCQTEPDIKALYEKHTRELKMAGNYLRNKKKKSEFELIAMQNFNSFYEEAVNATAMSADIEFEERFKNARKSGELCHGSFNYHNVLLGSKSIAVTNFDKYKNDCQIGDLYHFMRKILEKFDWNLNIAYKMIDEYDRINPIDDIDLKLLSVMFRYPEKFWKVINYYFNSNKSWIPRKSIEKLQTVVNQNEFREKFIETIA